jgi:hypothetical protein
MPSPADIDRVRDLGLVASVQPNFLRWQRPGGLYETALGPERTARMNPYGTLVERGCRVCFGSDGMPAGPLFGIREALSHPNERERLDEETALRLYTEAAAAATPGARCAGRMAEGEPADLAVLPDLPARTTRDEVDLTMLDGVVVFEREAARSGRAG